MNITTDESEREIVLSRVFDAPVSLVYRAYTEPEHVEKWWGPTGYTITLHEMDVRPGGIWKFMMHAPDGTDYPNRVIYNEVVPLQRLQYSHGDFEKTMFEVTTTFEEVDGKTKVESRMLFPTKEDVARVVAFGAIELGKQTHECLAEYLPKMK